MDISHLLSICLLFGIITSQEIDFKLEKNHYLDDDMEVHTIKKGRITQLDLIIEDFFNQKWDPDEIKCFDKTLNFLHNVKNSTLWAMWMWESMQSPVGLLYGSRYQLGNYDECTKTPWLITHPKYRTQYCLADIKLSNKDPIDLPIDPQITTENYINTMSKLRIKYNTLTWGVCVPMECKSKSVAKFVKSLFKNSYLGSSVPNFKISVDHCQNANTIVMPSEAYGFMVVLALLITIIILCTMYNVRNRENKSMENKFIKACCLETNALSLFKSSKNDIKAIHGIRVISSGMIVMLHISYVLVLLETSNLLGMENILGKFNFQTLFHLERAVDTYIMLSGFLMIRSLMVAKKVNPIPLIWNRYIRLVFGMWVLIVINIKIIGYTADGPMWSKIVGEELNMCKKNLWIGLLMLGNYFDTSNICYPASWSVPCDFHLSVICILLYWVYRRNRRLGILAFLSAGFLSLVLPGLVTYYDGLTAVPIVDMVTVSNYRQNLFASTTYLRSHLRAGPYFVGVVVGCLLSSCNLTQQRNKISKVLSITTFIASLSIIAVILWMSVYFGDIATPYNAWTSALFASFSRPLWAVAVSCIIIVCEYGTVPIIGSLLKAPMFLPLSKLNYGIYLAHTAVFLYMGMYIIQMRYNMLILITDTLVVTTISCFASLCLYLFFEAPVHNFMKIMTDMRYKNEEKIEYADEISKKTRKSE